MQTSIELQTDEKPTKKSKKNKKKKNDSFDFDDLLSSPEKGKKFILKNNLNFLFLFISFFFLFFNIILIFFFEDSANSSDLEDDNLDELLESPPKEKPTKKPLPMVSKPPEPIPVAPLPVTEKHDAAVQFEPPQERSEFPHPGQKFIPPEFSEDETPVLTAESVLKELRDKIAKTNKNFRSSTDETTDYDSRSDGELKSSFDNNNDLGFFSEGEVMTIPSKYTKSLVPVRMDILGPTALRKMLQNESDTDKEEGNTKIQRKFFIKNKNT